VYHHHQLSESEVGLVTIESSGTQNTCTYPTRHKKTRAAASVDPTNHRRKQMTNASSLPPHLLTPREEDEVKTFIEHFITMPQRDLSKVMGTDTGTSRSGGIYKRIEKSKLGRKWALNVSTLTGSLLRNKEKFDWR